MSSEIHKTHKLFHNYNNYKRITNKLQLKYKIITNLVHCSVFYTFSVAYSVNAYYMKHTINIYCLSYTLYLLYILYSTPFPKLIATKARIGFLILLARPTFSKTIAKL